LNLDAYAFLTNSKKRAVIGAGGIAAVIRQGAVHEYASIVLVIVVRPKDATRGTDRAVGAAQGVSLTNNVIRAATAERG
jgi:hypothetical protein